VIRSAVDLHDKLVMILSESSIEGNWAENEYNHSIDKEMRSGKTVLVPISLDDAVKYTEEPWAIKMRRSRYADDFSMWQDNDFYQEAFSYLLEELSAEEEAPEFDEFHLEEFDVEENISEAAKETDSRNLMQEFRAERRQFC
jgi:hypothetical protein